MLLYTSKGVTGSSHFRIRGLLPLRGMLVSDTGPAVANPNSSGKETVWNAPAGFSGLSPGLCPISGCQSPGRMRPVPSQAQRDLSAPVHCIMSICSCTWEQNSGREQLSQAPCYTGPGPTWTHLGRHSHQAGDAFMCSEDCKSFLPCALAYQPLSCVASASSDRW